MYTTPEAVPGAGVGALAPPVRQPGSAGLLLAKGHARTSGASMISGYLGSTDNVDRAMGSIARAYADQTERDYQELLLAVRRGVLPVD